jgi:hypothetical protein
MDNFTEMQNLARWLLAHEATQVKPSESTVQTAVCARVCDKLRRPLSTLSGVDGYRALISRALALAKVEVPSLGSVRVREDGSLEVPQGGMDETLKGGASLVAQLLGLLVAFIGVALTMQLVRDVWPDAPNYDVETERKP